MWIQTPRGFVSLVQDKQDRSLIQVRARVREHLAALFPGHEIIETPQGDYRYRVVINRSETHRAVHAMVSGIVYTNFKDEAARRSGGHSSGYVSALHRIWSILGDLQPGGPYNVKARRSTWSDRLLPEPDRGFVRADDDPDDEPVLECPSCGDPIFAADLEDDPTECPWCGHELPDDDEPSVADLERAHDPDRAAARAFAAHRLAERDREDRGDDPLRRKPGGNRPDRGAPALFSDLGLRRYDPARHRGYIWER